MRLNNLNDPVLNVLITWDYTIPYNSFRVRNGTRDSAFGKADCVRNVMAHAETRFRLSAKRASTFKSTGTSVQSTTGSRGVRISGSNATYTMFRGSVKGTGYPLHSPVFPSLPPRGSTCAITFQLATMDCMLRGYVQRRGTAYRPAMAPIQPLL